MLFLVLVCVDVLVFLLKTIIKLHDCLYALESRVYLFRLSGMVILKSSRSWNENDKWNDKHLFVWNEFFFLFLKWRLEMTKEMSPLSPLICFQFCSFTLCQICKEDFIVAFRPLLFIGLELPWCHIPWIYKAEFCFLLKNCLWLCFFPFDL